MSEYNEITAVITTDEPEIAATLDELRYLVFKGKQGDSAYDIAVQLGFEGTEEEWIASLKGERGPAATVPAYLDEGVVRYINDYGTHAADDIYTSLMMQTDIDNGVLPLVCYSPEDNVFDYFELDRYGFSGATRVVYFRSKTHLLSVDSTGAYALTDRPQGGSTITVDSALSDTSENPVQNKVVQAAFDERDGLMQKCQIVTEASENRWDKDSASTGLLGLDGRLYTGGSYDNYCYYNIGNVREGDVITSYKKQNTAVDSATMMRVVCYDSGGNAVVSAGTSTATQSFTVPSGIASVAICTTKNTGLDYNYMILVNAESAPTDYIPYVEHNVFYRATEDFLPKTSRLDKVNTLLGSDSPSASAATLASGTTLAIDNAPYFIKKNVSVSTRMNFETFTSIEIGKGQNSYRGKSVIVDGTSITQVSYNDSGTAVSGSVVAHGLTISDYLQVTMFMGDDGKCEVTLNTTSGTFATTFDFFAEWNYSPFVVGAQAMTDVQLGFSCSDICCPMWVFGDSYIGLYDNRVGGQLRDLGFFNVALIGVAGGRANDGSKATYPDLQRMLALGTPKYIIWTLGMNGGDAANVAFLPTLIKLCEDKGTELILYKVPHIPTIDHSTLNAYIESTGLRYIDGAAAVGADASGNWYPDMISSDGVHPSVLGAKALAMRYLMDVPEIMQYGKAETVPQMATAADMSDWVSGKTVDAAVLKSDFTQAGAALDRIGDNVDLLRSALESKADETDIPTAVSELTNDSGFQTAQDVQTAIAGKADKTPRIAKASTDTSATLNPNTLYVFPEMSALTITLAAPSDNTIVNEYHFIFTSGATATTLSIPATVNQPDGFSVDANMVYEVSILENNMTAMSWEVTA